MTGNETYSFEALLVHETDMAFLLEVDGEEKWFPKSQITRDGGGQWTLPEWLAIKAEIV